MIIEKCKYKNNLGEWHGEDAVWHISTNGKKTLCGLKVGTEEAGWFTWSHPDSIATCPKCIKIRDIE